MIRTSEKPIAYKAGLLAASLHGLLLVALLLSVNWQTNQTMHVAEVELWDSLPAPTPAVKMPEIKQPLPEPVVPEIKPEPEPAPPPEPEKPEIVLEKKPEKKIEKPVEKVVEKPKEKPIDKKPDLKKLQEEMRKAELNSDAEPSLQERMRNEDLGNTGKQDAAKSAASAGEVDKFKAAIQRTIQAKIVKSLCGTGNPTLTFDIVLMPTGELQSDPELKKSSNIPACDEAVERAILQSQPLPMPPDPSLRAQFRNLNLKFSPNQ